MRVHKKKNLPHGSQSKEQSQARAAGADEQVTGSSHNGLDQRDTEGINRLVQTKKTAPSLERLHSQGNPHHPAICTNLC